MSVNKKIILFCLVSLVSICVLLFYRKDMPEESIDTTNVEKENTESPAATGSAILTSASGAAIDGGETKTETSEPVSEKGNKKNEKKTADASTKEKNSADEKTGADSKGGSADKKKKTKNPGVSAKTQQKKQQSSSSESKGEPSPSVNSAADAASEPSPVPTADVTKRECTLQITCEEVFSHMDKLNESAKKVVPENGIILQGNFEFQEGDTAFDLLKKACASRNILLDYVFTPVYSSYYIKGIHNLYEFDCGEESGWLYQVNGKNPGYGCNQYSLKRGDRIVFYYSCENR